MRASLQKAALVAGIAIYARNVEAQTDDAAQAARQVVGLFNQACVRFAGEPAQLRVALKRRNVPELKPEARTVFMRDRSGVGFDASNRVARLAIVSQDSGLCDVFLGDRDGADVIPLLEQSLRQEGVVLAREHEEDRGTMHTVTYRLTLKSHPYSIVASVDPGPRGSVRAILTLAPQAR